MSYSFFLTSHYLIIIYMQSYLKALNLKKYLVYARYILSNENTATTLIINSCAFVGVYHILIFIKCYKKYLILSDFPYLLLGWLFLSRNIPSDDYGIPNNYDSNVVT